MLKFIFPSGSKISMLDWMQLNKLTFYVIPACKETCYLKTLIVSRKQELELPEDWTAL